jgi:integrase/recombinase XerD
LLGFLARRGVTLRAATLTDLQDWADELDGSVSSRARRISAIKSLLSFGYRTGYLPFNVGQVLEAPRVPNTLAERILTEEEVHRILLVARARDATLIRFLYGSGARISEACAVCWEHLHVDGEGEAVVTIHGKGDKTRHVLLSKGVTAALLALRQDDSDVKAPVFATRTGRPLHPANVVKSIRKAALKAGIDRPVSPHWLRHAHASHALDRGAPVHLVQATLGHASVATTGRYLHIKPGDGSGKYLSV